MSHIRRIVIADDHALVRRGLRRILETLGGFCVVGEAGDGHQAIRLVHEHKPDAVVLDLKMPEVSGIEAARRIRQSPSPPEVIVLTMHHDRRLVLDAFQAGCMAYIVKGSVSGELLEAIGAAEEGRFFLSKALHHLWPDIERRLGIGRHDHK